MAVESSRSVEATQSTTSFLRQSTDACKRACKNFQDTKVRYQWPHLERQNITVEQAAKLTFNTERYESDKPVYFPTIAILT